MKINPLRLVLVSIGASYTIRAAHLTTAAEHEEELIETFSFQFWLYAFISFALSCFAGICSGLTVGFMSISKAEMELWSKSQDPYERKVSKPILEILNEHHFLLSTLLLANALSLEALPIFLDKLVPPIVAVIISTVIVVVFGEVIPQAYCTGQNKVSIGYFFSPFIRFLKCILCPFVKPIVALLDKMVEHDDSKIQLSRENLKAVLLLHNSKQYGYHPHEIEILQNILDLRGVCAGDVMIPLRKVYMLPETTVFDEKAIDALFKANFSKIPIYKDSKENVIGYFKVKNLFEISISGKNALKQNNLITKVLTIKEADNLLDAIDKLKTEKINFGIVTNENGKCRGIITLKQIFEKIVLKEFKDDDIQGNLEFNAYGAKMEKIEEGKEQD